jgi:hypothetical protein
VSVVGRTNQHQIYLYNPGPEPRDFALLFNIEPNIAEYIGSYRIKAPDGSVLAEANYGEVLATITPPLGQGGHVFILETTTDEAVASTGELSTQGIFIPALAIVGRVVGGVALSVFLEEFVMKPNCRRFITGEGYFDALLRSMPDEFDVQDLIDISADVVVTTIERQAEIFANDLRNSLVARYGLPALTAANWAGVAIGIADACLSSLHRADMQLSEKYLQDLSVLQEELELLRLIEETNRMIDEHRKWREAQAQRRQSLGWPVINPFVPDCVLSEDEACDSGTAAVSLPIVQSYDPNEKVGILTVDGYLRSGSTLPYTIFFENLDEATFAAQEVFIYDVLDTSVDLDTFSFTGVGLLDAFYPVPEGTEFTAYIPLAIEGEPGNPVNPAREVLVEVQGSLDLATREVTVVFRGLDLNTGELHPFGFLNPNQTPPEGEGFVSYRHELLEGVVTGTEVRNQATIVFDVNEPIITNEVVLIIDDTPPVSSIGTMPDVLYASDFAVPVIASDEGSGVSVVELWYAYSTDPDAPSQPLRFAGSTRDMDAPEILLRDKSNGVYRFYTVATDRIGNRETLSNEPGAVVQVQAAPPPSLMVEPGTNMVDRDVMPGDVRVPLLQVLLRADDREAVEVTSLTLVAQGTGNDALDVVSVRIFDDLNGNGEVDAGEPVLASGQYPVDNGTIAVSLNYLVPAGEVRMLLVAYDFR